MILFSLFLCFNSAYALYDNSDVIDLTDTNFDSKVIDSIHIWIVEFYAPWCGHCQKFASEFSKAASALKGIVKVGGVDADKHKNLAARYSISGFPTVKIFVDKKNPVDYQGARTAKGVTDAAISAIQEKIRNFLSGGSESGRKSEKSSSKDVIELDDSNFDSLVLNSDDIWLVEFFAPWCGHCKNLAPHWAEAATQLKGKIKLGALDATVNSIKASEYNVRGYPTIKYFPRGKKTASSAEEYNGGRTANDIINWALDIYRNSLPPPEIHQIINNEILKEACENHPLCVISVLPHILDCQSECRNSYLSTLRNVADNFKQKGWGWLWSEAGSQQELENAFEIGGFGYPAMALFNYKKLKYSILKGSFSKEGISEFLRDVSFGRGSTAALKGASLPAVNVVEPWDGKDGELPAEEDIDLSDIDLDQSHSEL